MNPLLQQCEKKGTQIKRGELWLHSCPLYTCWKTPETWLSRDFFLALINNGHLKCAPTPFFFCVPCTKKLFDGKTLSTIYIDSSLREIHDLQISNSDSNDMILYRAHDICCVYIL